jgi:uncharacterized protein (TIGR00251 family)
MALFFEVKVTPSSGRIEWKLDKSDNLKCYLKSSAEQGKANAELIKTVAKAVGVTQYMVTIVSGGQSRKKRIKIDVDMTYDKLLGLLGIDRQISLF